MAGRLAVATDAIDLLLGWQEEREAAARSRSVLGLTE